MMGMPISGSKNYRTLLWMAWRGLIARRKKAGLNFMTVVSILGVATGVAALIIVLSVMGGFEADLYKRMCEGQPHLELTSEKAGVGISLRELPINDLRKRLPDAVDMEPFIQADVVAKHGKHYSPLTVFGIDPERSGHLWAFHGSMTVGQLTDIATTHAPYFAPEEPSERAPGIVLGKQLATQLGVDLGDEISVISPEANTSSVLGGATLARRYIVVGKFVTGMFNYDARWAVVSLPEARKFMPAYDPSLDEDDYVTGIAINVKDPMRVNDAAARFKDIPGIATLTWMQTNKAYLFALKLEKFAMGSVLMLIVLVAAFSISGTLMMTVFHKRGQVALLRSLGMTNTDVARLFLLHGLGIGLSGIALGVTFGVLICAVIYFIPSIPLPTGVYYLKSLPVKFLPLDYVVISLLALLLSLLAAIWPAITASRQDPVNGLRVE
jgi:lipoprotein-releasing system permease protein